MQKLSYLKRSSCRCGISDSAGGGGNLAEIPLRSRTCSFATATNAPCGICILTKTYRSLILPNILCLLFITLAKYSILKTSLHVTSGNILSSNSPQLHSISTSPPLHIMHIAILQDNHTYVFSTILVITWHGRVKFVKLRKGVGPQ